jgi:hypothetical protein
MFTIHKLFNEAQGTVGWVVVFDNTEILANFANVDDAISFADIKKQQHADAKEALVNAYNENMY